MHLAEFIDRYAGTRKKLWEMKLLRRGIELSHVSELIHQEGCVDLINVQHELTWLWIWCISDFMSEFRKFHRDQHIYNYA